MKLATTTMVKLGWLKLAGAKAKTNIIGGQTLTGYSEEPADRYRFVVIKMEKIVF